MPRQAIDPDERKERARARSSAYYQRNRDAILQRNRDRANANYAQNREEILRRRAEQRILRNREKLLQKLEILRELEAENRDPNIHGAPRYNSPERAAERDNESHTHPGAVYDGHAPGAPDNQPAPSAGRDTVDAGDDLRANVNISAAPA